MTQPPHPPEPRRAVANTWVWSGIAVMVLAGIVGAAMRPSRGPGPAPRAPEPSRPAALVEPTPAAHAPLPVSHLPEWRDVMPVADFAIAPWLNDAASRLYRQSGTAMLMRDCVFDGQPAELLRLDIQFDAAKDALPPPEAAFAQRVWLAGQSAGTALLARDQSAACRGLTTAARIEVGQLRAGAPFFGDAPQRETITTPPPQRSGSSEPATTPAFHDGLRDRTAWEDWLAQQPGEYGRGARYWANQRSLAHPGACTVPGEGTAWVFFAGGCEAAKPRLTLPDRRRREEPDYRAGWNSYAQPASAGLPSVSPVVPPAATPFDAGLADRAAWEGWLASQTGEMRRGAVYWASQRSLPHPGACFGAAREYLGDFTAGCTAAQQRLADPERRRRAEPAYRAGWNSYATSAPAAPPDAGAAQQVDLDVVRDVSRDKGLALRCGAMVPGGPLETQFSAVWRASLAALAGTQRDQAIRAAQQGQADADAAVQTDRTTACRELTDPARQRLRDIAAGRRGFIHP